MGDHLDIFPVLYSLDINHAFQLSTNVVCGLSFSRSQPDFDGYSPSQSSLRLRERASSRSDITNRAVQAHRHIGIKIARATARYECRSKGNISGGGGGGHASAGGARR